MWIDPFAFKALPPMSARQVNWDAYLAFVIEAILTYISPAPAGGKRELN
jgi:hypothetical protein